MALDSVCNFAKVTVSTTYDDVATSIVLTAGHGAKLTATPPYNLVWWDSTNYPDPSDDANKEIVRCTACTTDTLTVTRAQEGTTATTKNTAGATYKMILAPTKKLRDDIEAGKFQALAVNQTAAADSVLIQDGGAAVLQIYDGGIVDLAKQSRVRGTRATTQTIASATNVIVQYNTETFDVQNEYDNVTNFRFTATKAGAYLVNARILYDNYAWTAGQVSYLSIFKNAAEVSRFGSTTIMANVTAYFASEGKDIIYLEANDYIDIRAWHNQAADINIVALALHNFFSIIKLS